LVSFFSTVDRHSNGYVGTLDATASKVLTSVNCSYGANCKIMVIKHSNGFLSVTSVLCLKELLYTIAILTQIKL